MNMILSFGPKTIRTSTCAAAALIACSLPQDAVAQDYPEDDIIFIVPYNPGGSSDILAREYTQLLSEKLGVNVVVQNVSGGSGTIGTVELFGAEPDGYTIGYGHNSPLAIQPHRNADLPYSGIDDFTPIGGIGAQAGTVSVNSASDYQTFADLVAAAEAAPETISIAVGSAGNVKDMQLQQVEKAAGVEFNIVPSSGGGSEAVASVLGRIVDAVSVNASSVAGQIASGDLRPIAIFAKSPRDEVAGFEVINSDDYPGLVILQDTSGIIAPAGLPDEVLTVLSDAHQEIMQDEGFLESLEESVYIIDPADPETYKAQLMEDYENFGAILGQ
ncbi:Bug family tripartite tricarboxylate transporter substrate binding protein [Roseitranquillus sediminis]|uniref:Bug family tripartite tricarboxylate transporter substrate binding protein n=1 Tax=Roseitranquillus sediminis TaxID=2809051 RepID=UPI001D0C5478|nr:tripartite tricarboxylate transporter substrate binding protein [Roseitranquillus sediminis]MBM9593162.1 tripartite tricarboxylate transporter substrate binding protein [Roseitranquillus sediminis]